MLDRWHHCVESVPHCVPPHVHSRRNCFPFSYHCLNGMPCWFFANSPLSFTLLPHFGWAINHTTLPTLLGLGANISILGEYNNRTPQACDWSAKATTMVSLSVDLQDYLIKDMTTPIKHIQLLIKRSGVQAPLPPSCHHCTLNRSPVHSTGAMLWLNLCPEPRFHQAVIRNKIQCAVICMCMINKAFFSLLTASSACLHAYYHHQSQ